MPFTFSHPAIILPLTYLPKKWFSLTGLIVGSLTPDFEYFVRMRVQSNYSHTISGIFWFDLPLGIVLTFIFHDLVRNMLFSNLPMILRARLLKFNDFDWNAYFVRNWRVVVSSLLIGAFSRSLWDSFTHEHGYFVEFFPTLTKTVSLIGREIPILKILQHSSTLIGAIAIILALCKVRPEGKATANSNSKYWLFIIVVTLLIVALRIIAGLSYTAYAHLIVTGISAILISLTLAPLRFKRQA